MKKVKLEKGRKDVKVSLPPKPKEVETRGRKPSKPAVPPKKEKKN